MERLEEPGTYWNRTPTVTDDAAPGPPPPGINPVEVPPEFTSTQRPRPCGLLSLFSSRSVLCPGFPAGVNTEIRVHPILGSYAPGEARGSCRLARPLPGLARPQRPLLAGLALPSWPPPPPPLSRPRCLRYGSGTCSPGELAALLVARPSLQARPRW